MALPTVDKHKHIPRHRIPLHAGTHQGTQTVKAVAHVGRLTVEKVRARRLQSDHDRTNCTIYDADTGAKKRRHTRKDTALPRAPDRLSQGCMLPRNCPLTEPPGDTSAASRPVAHGRCRARYKRPLPSGPPLHTAPRMDTSISPNVSVLPCDPDFDFSGPGVFSPERVTQSKWGSPHAHVYPSSFGPAAATPDAQPSAYFWKFCRKRRASIPAVSS